MPRVCIGIHVHAEPERLSATLASVRANTTDDVEILLMGDGPDVPTRAFFERCDLAQSSTVMPQGTAACFNRLAAYSDADVIVLLESGCLVGPGWLEHLLAALDADPCNGLAGPSTNNAWNEQNAFPTNKGNFADVVRTADEAAQRFGRETRELAPLHSLADFCYAVRREVIEAVGAADESYGLGPCWEMDYNIRAARAGWRGVWACGAYVWRALFTPRRRLEEARRFEICKRLYQDRFCGARLRGEKKDYRPHCRGDECPNFAPADLIQIHRPLPAPSPIAETTRPPIPQISSPVITQCEAPLVSCIMPTYNRRAYIERTVRCFLDQDYPNLELIVVDDGTDKIDDLLPADARTRYFRLEKKLSIGAKRNFACEQARGEIIVHWDDDDWYPSWRVSEQVKALEKGNAQITGSSRVYYLDPAKHRAWEYVYKGTGAKWVAGNTLAYRASVWRRHQFQDIQVGEDSRFVWNFAAYQISDLADPRLCIATVHEGNTSRKETSSSYWQSCPVEQVLSLIGEEKRSERDLPLISCIMPTYNRRRFVPLALDHFFGQDYPNRELIIVDDGEDSVADLVENSPAIRYIRCPRASIGAKRNLACEHARGDLIAHWDDDDWYAPSRLRYQVMPILDGEADITGLENSFILELPRGTFWTTKPELHRRMFVGDVHGGTLVYRKKIFSEGLHYPEINLAEDAWLLREAMRHGKKLKKLANPGVFIYVRHGSNAWGRWRPGDFLDPSGWQQTISPPTFSEDAINGYLMVS